MTEKQATGLWCPMTQVIRSADGVARAANDQSCIAGKCAMWRWGHQQERRFIRAENREATTVEESGGSVLQFLKEYTGFDFVPYDPEWGDPAGWRETEEAAAARRIGWCGLAGSPAQTF